MEPYTNEGGRIVRIWYPIEPVIDEWVCQHCQRPVGAEALELHWYQYPQPRRFCRQGCLASWVVNWQSHG